MVAGGIKDAVHKGCPPFRVIAFFKRAAGREISIADGKDCLSMMQTLRVESIFLNRPKIGRMAGVRQWYAPYVLYLLTNDRPRLGRASRAEGMAGRNSRRSPRARLCYVEIGREQSSAQQSVGDWVDRVALGSTNNRSSACSAGADGAPCHPSDSQGDPPHSRFGPLSLVTCVIDDSELGTAW